MTRKRKRTYRRRRGDIRVDKRPEPSLKRERIRRSAEQEARIAFSKLQNLRLKEEESLLDNPLIQQAQDLGQEANYYQGES